MVEEYSSHGGVFSSTIPCKWGDECPVSFVVPTVIEERKGCNTRRVFLMSHEQERREAEAESVSVLFPIKGGDHGCPRALGVIPGLIEQREPQGIPAAVGFTDPEERKEPASVCTPGTAVIEPQARESEASTV